MSTQGRKPAPRNPVAKFAGRFNRAKVFSDRTRYRRHAKHKGREPFPSSTLASR